MMILFVAIGGAIGASCRYAIQQACLNRSKSFPWPTLIANIIGSFLFGLFIIQSIHLSLADYTWQFLGAGFCGGLTTFSTFIVDTYSLIQQKQTIRAMAYLISTIGTSVLSLALGLYLSLFTV